MRRVLSLRAVVYTLSLLVCVGLVLPAVADRRPECQQAQEWIEAHKGELPNSLRAIGALPIAYRRAIVGRLTPERRAELWRARLAEVATRDELTDGQRELVKQAQSLITPELYSPDLFGRKSLPDSWVQQAKREFRYPASSLITELGDGDGSFSTWQSSVLKLRRSVNHVGVVLIQPSAVLANPKLLRMQPDCQCTTEYPEFGCGSGTICCGYNIQCTETVTCGPLGGSICEGMCRDPSSYNCQF